MEQVSDKQARRASDGIEAEVSIEGGGQVSGAAVVFAGEGGDVIAGAVIRQGSVLSKGTSHVPIMGVKSEGHLLQGRARGFRRGRGRRIELFQVGGMLGAGDKGDITLSLEVGNLEALIAVEALVPGVKIAGQPDTIQRVVFMAGAAGFRVKGIGQSRKVSLKGSPGLMRGAAIDSAGVIGIDLKAGGALIAFVAVNIGHLVIQVQAFHVVLSGGLPVHAEWLRRPDASPVGLSPDFGPRLRIAGNSISGHP